MRILMLVANDIIHDPRVLNEARVLRAKHSITILGVDYGSTLTASDTIEGIRILRVQKPRLMKWVYRNFFRLMVYQFFAARIIRKLDFDILYCHNLDTLCFGLPAAKKMNKPVVYDAHEIYGFMQRRSLPQWLCNLYMQQEKKMIQDVQHVITVNQPLEAYFKSITNQPVTVIRNAKSMAVQAYQPPDNDIFTLLYIGTLTAARFLVELVDVAAELKNCRLILGGIGRLENTLREQCASIPHVTFLGHVPMEQVIPKTLNCDVIISMTSPHDPNNSIATANKQYEAMACGRPIICTAGTYPGELTQKENVGLTADFNKTSLKKTILKLQHDPALRETLGRNALKKGQAKYNWDLEIPKLIQLINTIH